MDSVMYQKGALFLYGHGVSVGGGATEITEARLNEIIDYAQTIGMDIITHSELYDLMKF